MLGCIRIAFALSVPALLAGQTFDEAFFKGDPKTVMLACAARAVQLKPTNAHVLAQAGRVQLIGGERAKAEASFSAIRPQDAETARWMGQGWLEIGETEKGLGQLTHIPHSGFGAKDELRTGAVRLMEAGHAKEADAVMSELFAWDSGDWENLAMYCRSCLRQGHQDLAAAWYARAAASHRKDGELWAEIAVSLVEEGGAR